MTRNLLVECVRMGRDSWTRTNAFTELAPRRRPEQREWSMVKITL